MDEKEGRAKGKGPEGDTVDGSAGHEHDGDDEQLFQQVAFVRVNHCSYNAVLGEVCFHQGAIG